MRRVKYKNWIPREEMLNGSCSNPRMIVKEGTGCYAQNYTSEGLFHQWANSYEEFESGPGNYTIALVEIEDGTIVEILPYNIKFIKE